MSNGRRRRRRFADKPSYHASAFGGWGDYRTWAEHQFLPKPAEAEAEDAQDVEVEDGARDVEAHDGARDVETDDGVWDAEVAVVGQEGAYGAPEGYDAPEGYGALERYDAPEGYGAPEGYDVPERSWADADEHHYVESSPDAVPRATPTPATDPDWAPPHSTRYENENSRPVGPRPYVISGGRTHGDAPLRMDTLISVTPQGTLSADDPALSPEYRWICDMCREPMAVVEIAGRLRMPIGVAIVLIGDAIGWNLLRMHPLAEVDNQPSLSIITRVREGLLRLP
ncbi:DUF742 domain-containing protein [Streptosporangium sp. NPDC049304]|uniref:DUF742 domain-containing protein n=1 Tax=Streptosporangium sp. NPDC049304 TaxID=3154830 RepID=UPI003438F131